MSDLLYETYITFLNIDEKISDRTAKVLHREFLFVLKMNFVLIMMMSFVFFGSLVNAIQPRAPNFQYFERPKYRYPYYDENGVGRLLYGYGDEKLYQYKSFTPLEGIH
ncbi:uncharacterized protein LOC123306838 isoform X2 [Coccinella septempunctata]|uniref:uncharacterized protein LOC123306838 isoform X2 n=1 Tax=Coccinella septempunctata TaxID=41139 RepID=UPI001D0856DE|nr:uncharacterized protein LOC123306838 isoform X2 [Coccinella septempunctata]